MESARRLEHTIKHQQCLLDVIRKRSNNVNRNNIKQRNFEIVRTIWLPPPRVYPALRRAARELWSIDARSTAAVSGV